MNWSNQGSVGVDYLTYLIFYGDILLSIESIFQNVLRIEAQWGCYALTAVYIISLSPLWESILATQALTASNPQPYCLISLDLVAPIIKVSIARF